MHDKLLLLPLTKCCYHKNARNCKCCKATRRQTKLLLQLPLTECCYQRDPRSFLALCNQKLPPLSQFWLFEFEILLLSHTFGSLESKIVTPRTLDCSVSHSHHAAFFSPRILQIPSMLHSLFTPGHCNFPVARQPLDSSTSLRLGHPLE